SSAETAEGRRSGRARALITSVNNFFRQPYDAVPAYLGGAEIAILKACGPPATAPSPPRPATPRTLDPAWDDGPALCASAEALLARLRGETRASLGLGIGRYHPGIGGLVRSYQDAAAALHIGQRFSGRGRVYTLDRLGVGAFIGLTDEATKVDLARHLLGPLERELDLVATLEAFFAANCSPSATAAALAIHRNTLTYRLDKVRMLTGLDPRNFDEAVQIRSGLLLLRT
ncbi:MAG TPA: helix-turn-helix domain-containing protein, partial [Chloroflexia bacterium]|nr:helix-turn-helix domain-containing protein [Chloroflexia bacterium]